MKSGKKIINKSYIQCDYNYEEILNRKNRRRKNWGNGKKLSKGNASGPRGNG